MRGDTRFEIRPYADGDETAILGLFAESFPHAPRSLGHFDWKYRRNPFGNRRIVLTFDERKRLVGHYAAYPVPFRWGTRNLLAHQVGDTMTDPGVRHIGRGATSILGRTALEFYRRFCGGVAFNYGFNVSNIQKFSLRFLRSECVEPVMYRSLNPSRLKRTSRLERRAHGFTLELVERAGPAFDEFFGRASHAYELLVRRDAAYLRWRYLDCPDRKYTVVAVRKWLQMVGWIVYRTEGSRLILGDMLLHPGVPEALDAVLAHVVELHGSVVVEGWFPPRPAWLSEHLGRVGFTQQPEPQDLSLMCVPFALAETAAVMRRSLYYTWGDSDLF